MMKNLLCVLAMLMGTLAGAQGGMPPAHPASTSPGSVGDIQSLLTQLEQTAQATSQQVAGLRIDKWKTDGSTKNQLQGNAESVQRNLTAALPGMIQQVRSAPDDISASFKLYRNLGALYDVLSSLTESAGAFGSNTEFRALEYDLSGLDKARHVLGDRLETIASIKEAELVRLRNQLRAQTAAATPAAPKKVIVDDEPSKKPVKKTVKKKPAAKPSDSATTDQQKKPE